MPAQPPSAAEPCVRLVPVFAALSPPQQAEVARFARPVAADPGEHVVRAGEPSSRLFVVHTGSVKVGRRSQTGQETILRVLGPGEVIGESSFLSGAPPENDAVAVVPSRLCRFDHADLTRLLGQFPDIGVGMLRALAGKLESAERMVAALASSDVGSRVAAYLLDLPATWDADGRPVVHLPLPKNQVAAHLGTTPETLSRRLATLERDGLIAPRTGRDITVLDPAALADRASA